MRKSCALHRSPSYSYFKIRESYDFEEFLFYFIPYVSLYIIFLINLLQDISYYIIILLQYIIFINIMKRKWIIRKDFVFL